MRNLVQVLVLSVLLALVLPGLGATAAETAPSAETAEARFERYCGNGRCIKRARSILDQLARNAEIAVPEVELKVEVTERPASPRTEGGVITIPSSLFTFCYGPEETWKRRKKRWTGPDSCLAFPLAHELAHLARDDQGVRELSRRHDDARGRSLQESRAELLADAYGLSYLWRAGFDPHYLFEPVRPEEEFFTRYASYFGWMSKDELSLRRGEIERQMRDVTERLPLFHWGAVALALGRYEAADALLEGFEGDPTAIATFPSREVLSNRGLIAYQRYAQVLAACDGRLVRRFKLPVRIDAETLAAATTPRGGRPRSRCFSGARAEQLAERAEKLLASAIEQDPEYLPAHLNLLALWLLQEDGSEALAHLEKPRLSSWTKLPEWINASALAHSLLPHLDPDRFDELVIHPLTEAVEKHPEAEYLRANLDRILREQGRSPLAPPKPRTADANHSVSSAPEIPKQIRLGRRPSSALSGSLSLEGHGTAHWSSVSPVLRAWSANGRVRVAERQVLGTSAGTYLETYGPPARTVATADGEFHIHDGWAYRVAKDRVVSELWFDFGE